MIDAAFGLTLFLAFQQTSPDVVITGGRDTAARHQVYSVSGDCKGVPVSIEVSHDTGRVMAQFGEQRRDVSADIPPLDIARRDRSLARIYPICRFEGNGMMVLFLIADVQGTDIIWSWRSFDVDQNLNVSGVKNDTPVTPIELARAFD